MQFCLRESKPEDFEALWQLDQQCFPRGISYSRRELAYYTEMRGAFTLVAETEVDGEIAGFIVARSMARGMGHIVTIDVHPSRRRHHVGMRLLQGAEERLRQAGCRSVYLETAVDNASAIAFYKRLRYFVLKVIPRYYQGKVDAFLMGKNLGETSTAC